MNGSEKEERMEISVMLTSHLVTIKKPLSFTKKVCKLQKKPVIRPEKEEPMEISVMLVVRAEVYERRKGRAFGVDNPLKTFYDAVIGPSVDLLGPEDDELVIVSDGELCFTPWALVIESIRIRTVPSLTSYQLILSVSESHHKKTGALLVRNPCLKELKEHFGTLPGAQKEVECIAFILNTITLIGRQGTKAEMMKRISSVGVIHIAAFANKLTGEIVLSPNPGWTSRFPLEKDYILKMSEVQTANLRARPVVLSCSHSGGGRILKGEGVCGWYCTCFLGSWCSF